MTSRCVMWLLVFTCISAAGGVPVNLTQNIHPVDNVTSVADVSPSAAAEALKVANGSLNDVQNGTAPASVASVASALEPMNQSAETLEELQEDMVVQEGDILVPEDRNAVSTVWSGAVVPYIISPELAYREPEIYAAFKMISDYTCIRFHRRTHEMNYLEFKDGKGCASFVGCRGGAQALYCAPSCTVGNLCHEIIHSLGLHHEHTRQDRDQYITVMWQSIVPGRSKNFKIKSGDTQNLPYDLNSIMHYGEYFFSVDGSPTMLPKIGGVQMGQRTHLSQLDVQRLNGLYHCDERMNSYG